jgi:hypothetical protein
MTGPKGQRLRNYSERGFHATSATLIPFFTPRRVEGGTESNNEKESIRNATAGLGPSTPQPQVEAIGVFDLAGSLCCRSTRRLAWLRAVPRRNGQSALRTITGLAAIRGGDRARLIHRRIVRGRLHRSPAKAQICWLLYEIKTDGDVGQSRSSAFIGGSILG